MKSTKDTRYAGLDVAKQTLQLCLEGNQYSFANDAPGQDKLVLIVRAVPQVQVVTESIGVYDVDIVRKLRARKVPVSVVNPVRVRHFARAQGLLAKSDVVDAALLSAYGSVMRPAITPPSDPKIARLRHLVHWRSVISRLRLRVGRAEELRLPSAVAQRSRAVQAYLREEEQRAENAITKLVNEVPVLRERVKVLSELDGVGVKTATHLLCYMPELGKLNRRQAAALAGLAPFTRQSGTMNLKRRIYGGRKEVRTALYMSAMSLSYHNRSPLADTYWRLRKAGKPALVALVALMRKLLVRMNSVMRQHLAASTAAEADAPEPGVLSQEQNANGEPEPEPPRPPRRRKAGRRKR